MATSYFSHDSNARNSDTLIPVRMKYGVEGYGIFFMIIERLREEKDYMSVVDYNAIAYDLRVDSSKVKSVVEDFGLFVFTEDGKYFYSESLHRRMKKMDTSSKKRSEAGKKGAAVRWGIKEKEDSNAITENGNAIDMPSEKMANKIKLNKIKLNKMKLNKTHKECFDKVLLLFEQCPFDAMTESDVDTLVQFVTSFEYPWIEEAFAIAKDNHAMSLKYVKGILDNWQRKGKPTGSHSKKNKFHNFQGVSEKYTEEQLEAIAKKKERGVSEVSKYNNKKVTVDGIRFDSKKEAKRYGELKLLERAGEIQDLELQPRFLLQDSFQGNGCKHRKIEYVADFMYFDKGKQKTVVEDVKGIETDVYKLKKKLFLFRYPEYEFMEIRG